MSRTISNTKQISINALSTAQKHKAINGSLVTSVALGLSGCGGSDSATGRSPSLVIGLAIKGLLDDFCVFFDSNGNGVYDQGDLFTITDAARASLLKLSNLFRQ